MPVVIHRLLRSGMPSGPGGGFLGGTVPYQPLAPWQVRTRRFRSVPVWRRGIDPAEVASFLSRLAGDLELLHAELERTRAQNRRIKAALSRWRSTRVGVPGNGVEPDVSDLPERGPRR
nr:DivIVA domain-containing protein [Micromonospora sp. DSM 115978]